VIVVTELVSSTPPPTSLYDLADPAGVAGFHLNVSELFVELTNKHGGSIHGTEITNMSHVFQCIDGVNYCEARNVFYYTVLYFTERKLDTFSLYLFQT